MTHKEALRRVRQTSTPEIIVSRSRHQANCRTQVELDGRAITMRDRGCDCTPKGKTHHVVLDSRRGRQ